MIAGGKGKGAGRHQLDRPYGVAVDGVGNYIVVDMSNHRLLKCAVEGEVVASARQEKADASLVIPM